MPKALNCILTGGERSATSGDNASRRQASGGCHYICDPSGRFMCYPFVRTCRYAYARLIHRYMPPAYDERYLWAESSTFQVHKLGGHSLRRLRYRLTTRLRRLHLPDVLNIEIQKTPSNARESYLSVFEVEFAVLGVDNDRVSGIDFLCQDIF